MSFTDRLVLWLHILFVIFTIGPVTIAIMSSLRAIRTRNIVLLRYLVAMTRIFSVASLGVLIFGIILAQQQDDLGQAWLAVAITLYVVALVLLVLIMRDQRRAIAALQGAGGQEAAASRPAPGEPEGGPGEDEAETAGPAQPAAVTAAAQAHVATVERGRIASIGGVVSLIWLAILVLMVWNA
ncbi:MAG TPA: hypothetical protein VGQ26_22785 [Streptosporangiaceae bacterium]|jgi:hypothetical protein|nr:hypothetical protein [Streptosporangiaceae bacterium]